MTTFDRYIRDGRAAVETHPDRRPDVRGPRPLEDRLEFDSAAADTIASILHALDADAGITPREAHETARTGGGFAKSFLERAYRSYTGDFEDLDDEAEGD